MKPLSKMLLAIVFLAPLFPHVVFAQDYISEAVQALQQAHVYVAEGTKGTDNDTAAKMESMLKNDDKIVLVMFPEEAMSDTDIYSIAKILSDKLGNQPIIGLAVGREVIGYCDSLPPGIAADMMKRANSVSSDPVTALRTFVQNIHSWQAKNPDYKPTPTPAPTATPAPTRTPVPLPKMSDVPWLVWATLIGLAALSVAIFIVKVRANAERSRRWHALRPVESKIREIQAKVPRIVDRTVRGNLENACLIGLGLLDILRQSNRPHGQVEEKFPELITNMGKQVTAFMGHESGRYPLSSDTLAELRKVLLAYDDLFIALQNGSPESADLMVSIIGSNNAIIQTLGYLPEEKNR